jgi:hypothetical protein
MQMMLLSAITFFICELLCKKKTMELTHLCFVYLRSFCTLLGILIAVLTYTKGLFG